MSSNLINQPTSAPTRKVASVGVVTIVVPVLVIIAGLFGWELNVELATTTLVAMVSAVTGIIALVTSYRTRNTK